MDRAGTVTGSDRGRRGPAGEFVLPSRSEAIAGLASALDSGAGPVVLTGEPGVGKTWVCRKLRDHLPASWRWVAVDLSPSIDEGELLAVLLHAVGLGRAGGTADSRAALGDLLADGGEDGARWGLIVDEAQNASLNVLEELRVLGNRMGEPGSFAGLVLVGQNSLGRRLATPPLASLRARVARRIHLRPLDVDEMRAWLLRLEPGKTWDEGPVEWLHRETGGNPRRVLGRTTLQAPVAVGPAPAPGPPALPPNRGTVAAREDRADAMEATTWEPTPVGPQKPPLRVSEGMIEVGWEPPGGTATGADSPAPKAPEAAEGVEAGVTTEEVIDDHYAALQAWGEWSRNQGREAVAVTMAASPAVHVAGEPLTDLDPDENPAARISGLPGIRAEGQHEFAPYGHLFSQLRQPRESE